MARPLLVFATAFLLLAVCVEKSEAASPQFIPAYPLYCNGPLTTGASSGGETATAFQWASTGAGAANPAPGRCAWADRTGRGLEVIGGGNVICDFSAAMQSVPAGTFVEVGVARDPIVNNCMHLARYIGPVSPPFSGVPYLQPFVRPSIVSLSPAQTASLRHGIAVMMSRPVTDPTSYRFQANIHGTEDSPTTAAEMAAWNQCEHASYFFFSWHRMYLYFFDRILRAAAGDPTLVLPYWNWSDPNQYALPAAFRLPADSTNPLYIAPPGRPSQLDAGTAYLSAGVVSYLGAFGDTQFQNGGQSGFGFGGGVSQPMQFSSYYGDLEMQPHNIVHSTLGGLMGDPLTAAQDPIFWLHHAMIDRLWNKWIQQGGRTDSGDAAWLNTTFTFYDEAGHAVYLTGSEVVDAAGQLNYRYDDDPAPMMRHRFVLNKQLLAQAIGPRSLVAATVFATSIPLAKAERVRLNGTPLRLKLPVTEVVRNSLHRLRAGRPLYLRIDDIRTIKPPGYYYAIYIDAPEGQKLDEHTTGFVGNLSLFSLLPHRMAGGKPTARGDVFVDYNVTAQLQRIAGDRAGTRSVELIPRGLVDREGRQLPLPPATAGSIGSVRLISQ